MKKQNPQFDKHHGAALILVVVVTVLLAVIGVMFLMVSRLSEMETMAVADGRDLDSAVQTVVARIDEVLVEDLFGDNGQIIDDDKSDEPYDIPGLDTPLVSADPWLASLEPDPDNSYRWPHGTDLYDTGGFDNIITDIVSNSDSASIGDIADADGDGVSDSRWVKVPGMTTSRGKDVFAAVRIIDNCAMLNLNTVSFFHQDAYGAGVSPFKAAWQTVQSDGSLEYYHDNSQQMGRYLTEINYFPFLRGHDLNGDFWTGSEGDEWDNLMVARGFYTVNSSSDIIPFTASESWNILMDIEKPGNTYHLFDISDELEIRNRYLVTSLVEARFEHEDVANFSLDSGSTDYAALQVPRDNSGNSIDIWYERIDPANFDAWTGGTIPYKYDRRHVCTFYSFDRPLRKGTYPRLDPYFESALSGGSLTSEEIETIKTVFMPANAMPVNLRAVNISVNTLEARRQIVHLLYVFRAWYLNQGLAWNEAAVRSAQMVANMIDYFDSTFSTDEGPFYEAVYGSQRNPNRTYINQAVVRQLVFDVSQSILGTGYEIDTDLQTQYAFFDTSFSGAVYGYERQPFISEIYAYRDPATGGNVEAFGLELVNPYAAPISLDGWRISIGTNNYDLDAASSVPMAMPDGTVGRFTIWAANVGYSVSVSGSNKPIAGIGLGTQLIGNVIKLYRPDAISTGEYVLVDQTHLNQTNDIFGAVGVRVSKRDDTSWKCANNSAYAAVDAVGTLGTSNNVNLTANGYVLPVQNSYSPLYTLGDFEKVIIAGCDPNGITEKIALAAEESAVRYDIESNPELMDYISFLNRPDKGTLPGRININTAPAVVIAAAIPPALADPNILTAVPSGYSSLDLAQAIVDNRPYTKLSDLLTINRFKQYDAGGAWASENVGTQSIEDDIEEEHWILSHLANKLTVRSDVFTAYILVRLGTDGPQRRMIAIFDRSSVWSRNDRPKLVALHPLHPVPDPR